jgi:nucleoside-diphosphate-sugar epimerase
VSDYGRSKLRGEAYVEAWQGHPRSLILRPPVIYGPGDLKLLSLFRLARWRLAPLLSGGHNRLATIYIDDAVEAVVHATESDAGGKTFFVSDGISHSWRELYAAVEDALGVRAFRLHVPRWSFMTVATVVETYGAVRRRSVSLTRQKVHEMSQRHWVCADDAIRAELGWEPRIDLETGARYTVEWYREQGLL